MSLPDDQPRLCPYCAEEFSAIGGQISQCPACGRLIVFRDDRGTVEFEKLAPSPDCHPDLSSTVSPLLPGGVGDNDGDASRFSQLFSWLVTHWHPRQVAIEKLFINWWPASLLSFTEQERQSLRKAVRGRFRIKRLHDPRVAKWLAATGEPVPLQGLTSLSPPVARQLIKSSDSLLLSGLLAFCDTTAHHLSFHRGRTLYLDGLRSLPDPIAQILVRHRGRGLSLDGLTSIPIPTAELLITYQGRLSLDGLRSITPSFAALLATHKGPSLSLNGITTLSQPVAEHLSTYQGDLYLGGITELTGLNAIVFRDFPGKVVLRYHEIRPRRSSSAEAIEKESIKSLITLGIIAAIMIVTLIAILVAAMDAIDSYDF